LSAVAMLTVLWVYFSLTFADEALAQFLSIGIVIEPAAVAFSAHHGCCPAHTNCATAISMLTSKANDQ
ncbi:hypothetical protein K5D56_26830, partial [Pseudomonas cichorii]|nr:hypothetical protein [Pseudomonas cichorii]